MSLKHPKLEELINQAIKNIQNDRSCADSVLTPILQELMKSPGRADLAAIASKYMESLARGNEQLIRLIATLNAKRSVTQEESKELKNKIFDTLQEESDNEEDVN